MIGSQRTLDLGELTVAYTVAGEEDAPPVVLLHGGGFDTRMVSWRYVVPSLSDSFRVYTLDWPGYGESDPPERTPTTEYYVEILDRFLTAIDGDRPALLGVSLGGGVAVGYALTHPDRVRRLVAIDSYGLGGKVPGGSIAALFARSEALSGLVWDLIERSRTLAALSVRAAVHPPNLTDELIDDALAQLERPRATAAWRAFQRAEIGRHGVKTNYVGQLAHLSVPTLFVHGERDAFVPVEWALRAATIAPTSDIRIIPDCGHWTPRERPDAFVAAVEPFLSHGRERV